MACTRTDTATDSTITISDSAQITEADELALQFRAVLELKTPLITINLDGLEEVDICFFQLLVAFHNSLAKQSRHLMLNALPPHHVVYEQANLHGIKLEHFITIVGGGK